MLKYSQLFEGLSEKCIFCLILFACGVKKDLNRTQTDYIKYHYL